MDNMTPKQKIITLLKSQISDQLDIIEQAQQNLQQAQQNIRLLREKINIVANQPEKPVEPSIPLEDQELQAERNAASLKGKEEGSDGAGQAEEQAPQENAA